MPPNASDRLLDELGEVLRDGQVAADRERADAVGLTLEHVAPAGEHRDVRALGSERFRDGEAHPRGGAADDRSLTPETQVHQVGSCPLRATARVVIPPRMLNRPSTSANCGATLATSSSSTSLTTSSWKICRSRNAPR